MSGRDRAGVHRGPILRDGGPPSTRWLLTDASFVDGNVRERATISPARSGDLRRSRHREPSAQRRGHGDPAPRGVEHETRVARSSRAGPSSHASGGLARGVCGCTPAMATGSEPPSGGSDASCTRTRRLGAEPQSHREESEDVGSDLITHRAAPSRASSSDRRRDSRRGESQRARKRSVRGRDPSRVVGASSLSRGPTRSDLGLSPRALTISKIARRGRETTGTREAIEPTRADEAEQATTGRARDPKRATTP